MDIQTYLPYIVGILLPLLVGLSTKASTPNAAKAVLHVVLAIVAGPLLAWQAAKFSSGFDITGALVTSAVVWGTGVLSHYGFLKPVGLSSAAANLVISDGRSSTEDPASVVAATADLAATAKDPVG